MATPAVRLPIHATTIGWERLPADFPLPDDPVENTDHPILAAALREPLELAGRLSPNALVASNFAICAKVDGKTVVKAPDWVYIGKAHPTENPVRRSFTPHIEGDVPTIVVEFLSETDNGEYSLRHVPPYGKWWFYERILEIPVYVVFDPPTGEVEVFRLTGGVYERQTADAANSYPIAEIGLSLTVWQGEKGDRSGFWLRWREANGELLPWGFEKIAAERERAEAERERAEAECARAERLAERLRSLGVDPGEL